MGKMSEKNQWQNHQTHLKKLPEISESKQNQNQKQKIPIFTPNWSLFADYSIYDQFLFSFFANFAENSLWSNFIKKPNITLCPSLFL